MQGVLSYLKDALYSSLLSKVVHIVSLRMKPIVAFSVLAASSWCCVSCVTPVNDSPNSSGTYQDPNNPYAVPGVTTQGGGYTNPATAINPPATTAPTHPQIPSTPTYTTPTVTTPTPPIPSTTSSGKSHTVSGGDTLWALSRTYNTSVADLMQANNLSSSNIIPGQTLVIP